LDAAVRHFAELTLGWMYVAALNKTGDKRRNERELSILRDAKEDAKVDAKADEGNEGASSFI
jgi:hypothetical protein